MTIVPVCCGAAKWQIVAHRGTPDWPAGPDVGRVGPPAIWSVRKPALKLKPLHLLILIVSTNHVVMRGTTLCVLLTAVQLGASPAMVGLLAALFNAPVVFTSVAMGRWFDRSDARIPLLCAALVMSAGTATAFLWNGIGALFVVSLAVGVGYNVFVVGGHQQVGRYGGPGDKVANFSMSMQANSLANFIAPLITGFAIDGIGHANTFLLLAFLPMLSVVALASGWLKLVPPGAGGGHGAKRGNSLELLRPPLMRRIFAGAVLSFVALNFYYFLTPVYGVQVGLSASQIGMMVSALGVAMVVVRGAAPMVTRRVRPWQMMIASVAATGVGMMLLPLFSQMATLLAISFTLGLALGAGAPLALALMNEASPEGRAGEVMGLRLSILNGMQTIVPLGAGALGGVVGVGPVFAGLGVMLIAGAYYMRPQWNEGHEKSETAPG